MFSLVCVCMCVVPSNPTLTTTTLLLLRFVLLIVGWKLTVGQIYITWLYVSNVCAFSYFIYRCASLVLFNECMGFVCAPVCD